MLLKISLKLYKFVVYIIYTPSVASRGLVVIPTVVVVTFVLGLPLVAARPWCVPLAGDRASGSLQGGDDTGGK